MHYGRFLRNGHPGPSSQIKKYFYEGQECIIDNCQDHAKKKNLCVFHYDLQRGSSLSAQTISDMKKNGCYVCGSTSRLTLDHNHSCCAVGKSFSNCVRGILCHKCNTAAGLLDDDYERIADLALYILSKKEVLNYDYAK
jgi:hypothetical protein